MDWTSPYFRRFPRRNKFTAYPVSIPRSDWFPVWWRPCSVLPPEVQKPCPDRSIPQSIFPEPRATACEFPDGLAIARGFEFRKDPSPDHTALLPAWSAPSTLVAPASACLPHAVVSSSSTLGNSVPCKRSAT